MAEAQTLTEFEAEQARLAALSDDGLDDDGNPINSTEDDIAQQALSDFEGVGAQSAANETEAAKKDWRVRLHLAPRADYLYMAANPGILAPLLKTNGLIFPYTPEIAVQYTANYSDYELTHSNYKGYFYKGSTVQNRI